MVNVLLLLLTIIGTSSSIDVPTSLTVNESLTTDSSLSVTWDGVDDVIGYDLRYGPLHKSSTDRITVSTSSTSYTIEGLDSNKNFVLQVRSTKATETSEYSNIFISRTAPNGGGILNFLSAPTHITVLVEETPGATQWQIRYTKTNESSTVIAPTAGNSALSFHYLATLTGLTPNTVYQVQSRISQVFGTINFTESQSPYGSVMDITTEKISFFGKGVLKLVTYEEGNETQQRVEDSLREIYNESDGFHDVVVHRITNSSSGSVWCFHEVLVNDESAPNISAITSTVDSSFQEIQLFNAEHDGLGYFMEDNPPELRLSLIDPEDGMRPTGNQQCKFTISTASGQPINETTIEVGDTESENIAIIFDNQEISFQLESDGEILTGNKIQLPADQIYIIKQNYLFETTGGDDSGGGREYGADLGDPVKGSDYSIVHTTSSDNFVFEFQMNDGDDDNKVILLIRSPPDRLTRMLFTYGNTTNEFLTERYIDSSTAYQVELDSLEDLNEIAIDVSAFIRTANGEEIMRSSSFNISRCLPGYDSLMNGTVECNNGSFTDSTCVFTCSEEYTLNGESSITCLNDFNWSASSPTCEASTPCDDSGSSSTNECNQSQAVSSVGRLMTWVWVMIPAVIIFHMIFNASVYCSRVRVDADPNVAV